MNKTELKKIGVSGTALKLLALITMTVDHIGLIILDDYQPFRIIGRLAFPIFAYMIAEGCAYTKNKRSYLLKIALLGIACQAVYFIAEKSLFIGILLVFSTSVILIFSLQYAMKSKGFSIKWLLPVILICAVAAVCFLAPSHIKNFGVDYGFWGIMLPVFIFLGRNKTQKLILSAAGITAVCISIGKIQWWSLAALIPLALYNGKRGHGIHKNFFYIYYPAHLAVIYLIDLFIAA